MNLIKKGILLLIVIFINFAQAAPNKEVIGEGRFMAEDEDNLTFVKKILLFNAFEDIISKELHSMGLDSKLFWKSFNDQFDKSFAGVEQELKKKYLIDQNSDTAKNLSEEEKEKNREEYSESFRQKRLLSRTRLHNLSAAILQYKVLEMNRSTQEPKSRYLKVSAKVDQKELNTIYQKVTGLQAAKNVYRKLIVSAKFNLKDTNWNDLGVEVPAEFETTIAEHWLKWWQNNYSSSIPEIRLANSSDEKEYNDYFKLSDEAKEGAIIATSDLNPLYQGVLWLQVSFSIQKRSSNSLQGTRGFAFAGDYVLTDLGHNRVISFSEFSKPVQNFSYEQDHKLRSSVATAIYAIPLEQFVSAKGILQGQNGINGQYNLDISNMRTVNDLFQFEKYLVAKGITMQLTTQVTSIDSGKAKLRLYFSGDSNQLLQLIHSLNKQEIDDFMVLIKDKSRPFDIQFQPITGAKNE